MYNHQLDEFKLSIFAKCKNKKPQIFNVKTTFYYVHRDGTERLTNEDKIEVNRNRMDLTPVNPKCLDKAFVCPNESLVNGIVLEMEIHKK